MLELVPVLVLELEPVLVLEPVPVLVLEPVPVLELELEPVLELVLEPVLELVPVLSWAPGKRSKQREHYRQACRGRPRGGREPVKELTPPDQVAWPESAPLLVPCLQLVLPRCESCKSEECAPVAWAGI